MFDNYDSCILHNYAGMGECPECKEEKPSLERDKESIKLLNNGFTTSYTGKTNVSNDPWNNLKVGDELQKITIRGLSDYTIKVVEITEHLVATLDNNILYWWQKEELKECWTIKDSTFKEERETINLIDYFQGSCFSIPKEKAALIKEKLEQIKRILL